MKVKVIIPARGGSKGIPGKNIKPLGDKPLIIHTLNQARRFFSEEDIIITTDDKEILKVLSHYGYQAPFIRPAHLATDESGMKEVIDHAVNFLKKKGEIFTHILLLQPTSPFRKDEVIQDALGLINPNTDMIISVKETKANPYYLLFEEDDDNNLKAVKEGDFIRRQDCPVVYELNGALYLFKLESFEKYGLKDLPRRQKVLMDEMSSVDLDDMLDWIYAEILLEKKMVKIEN